MSELPDQVPPAAVPEPKLSSLGILARRADGGAWELLFGMRSRRSRFMPGNLAFPGGKLEAEDAPERAGALARCVAREVEEETGARVPAERWIDAGERATPPMFPVRFRTRFFVAALPEDFTAGAPPQPGEIEALRVAKAAELLAEWERGESLVPPPLIPILRSIEAAPPPSIESLAREIARVNAEEDPLPRIEFVPGIWVLPVRTRTLPPATHTNVWIPGGRRFVVVDPGTAEPGEQERILGVVKRREAGGGRVDAVVLTHQHKDHVAGASTIARALGVPVRAHARTFELLGAALDGVRGAAIADGERIDLDGCVLEALHTPGHAPGHLAFLIRERSVLISGDLVSGLSTILIGGLDGGDMSAFLESLRRARAAGAKQVLPSHGPPLPGKALEAALDHRLDRERKVAAAIAQAPRTLVEIAAEAYADTPAAPPFLRELQTRAHLEHLERQGIAIRDDAAATRWLRI